MPSFRIIVCALAFIFVSDILGQDDFDLSDAIPEPEKPTNKPAMPRKPSPSDDFDLGDALGPPDSATKKPPAQPQPGGPGHKDKNLGDFDLTDSLDGYSPDKTRDGSPATEDRTNENEAQTPGAIAGIVSAVAMALFGVASSYFAYQKKKLCFKQEAGHQDNVLMENQSKPRQGEYAQASLIGK